MTDTIQGDLREIAEDLLEGASEREAAGRLLEIASEIDRAVDLAHRAEGYRASHRDHHIAAGIRWNG